MTAILTFLALTFGISLIAFIGIAAIPGAQSPEGWPGLPVWLVAVWSPTIAAIILAAQDGKALNTLWRMIETNGISYPAWLALLIPFAILIFYVLTNPEPGDLNIGATTLIALFTLNLILGPMGEELGWRGFLQPALQRDIGWLGAALIVGVIWFVWHLPLWLVDSPQKEIPIALFAGHVLAYSVLLGAIQVWAGQSVLPAILFHLGVNLVAAWALVGGFGDTVAWYEKSLLPYILFAALFALITTIWAPCTSSACNA